MNFKGPFQPQTFHDSMTLLTDINASLLSSRILLGQVPSLKRSSHIHTCDRLPNQQKLVQMSSPTGILQGTDHLNSDSYGHQCC